MSSGHHYFRLGHLPLDVAETLADRLPHLYVRDEGFTRLRVESGRLDLREVLDGPGFGGSLGSFGRKEVV